MGDNRLDSKLNQPSGSDQTAGSLYEGAYGDSRLPVRPDGAEGQLRKLKLSNRSGDRTGADALVYIPPGFDDSKPVKLVLYNHGLRTNVSEAFQNSGLKAQLDKAEPNTILIMPEWQANPNSEDSYAGRFYRDGFVAKMLDEIMQKTPQLAGKTLKDVQSVDVFTHSGGYIAAGAEVYGNGLADKIRSVTLLDSLYNGGLFDRWVKDNLSDLAAGTKHFTNIYGRSTNGNSVAEADRIKEMLQSAHLPPSTMYEDRNGKDVLDARSLSSYGIVFKRSDVTTGGRNAHDSVTNLYPGRVLDAIGATTTPQYYAEQNHSPRQNRLSIPDYDTWSGYSLQQQVKHIHTEMSHRHHHQMHLQGLRSAIKFAKESR